ncbi:telomere-associated protein RIF1-like isoform X1 [Acipenser ruthenus]|uniref:telomere-associated protein RIF1-like isoform X1 n=1 Tax=Acipenser ruthenus TaxID=7906 RepID=UPI0027423070|nr:telomere-associated protein RIF1-like isoform X1 [Acipenser ruthenus]XP_033900776.3 telomere-associated protein RIF1-like isoform X1 [Acipenser ruthenus]XP_058889889.1 telomere-associated protein RIF1-like isoform X1 [Acipenser ruthenus]
MMATVLSSSSSMLPLLETLEDSTVSLTEQTDAYLTIAKRLSGEDGRQFIPVVGKHFTRLCKAFKGHISSQNSELCQAALQALGFTVFHSSIVSGLPASYVEELILALNSLAVKSCDKNTCTRALWVIAKQNFPAEAVGKKVPDILKTLETVHARQDVQSMVMEHEALNVVMRLLEQTPAQMGEGAVTWAKLVIPLVVHSAPKVRLRAAAALELGMPLLIEKQQEVAAITEALMSSKLIPELQKLFSSKNETNVLKLWPLFVRLLGKTLHRGGTFINSLLHLEELGFRSSSPVVKKIAFIAWKSLIDNFALNPDILCSTKRLKLLMQPLASIQVRTEVLLLTKLEVWWYLAVKLGPHFTANFEQVGIPLVQSTMITDSPAISLGTPARTMANQSISAAQTTPKTGPNAFASPASTPRLSLNSSVHASAVYPSIQLLGLEMLLHFLLGPDITAAAAQNKLQLSLEPLANPLITSPSFFCKHAGVLINSVRDGLITVGKEAADATLNLIWKNLIGFVTAAIETGNKKERQGSEVLTLFLQALHTIVTSEALPAHRALILLEATVKGIPPKILGSPAYQVANMDVLNGTPALFLMLLFYHSSLLESFVTEERFFVSVETLVGCGLSGPTSPLAYSESILNVINQRATLVVNKEHLWRMWSIVVNPLTERITHTNEVNQGDALEHNFTAVHSALMLPITHLLTVKGFPQGTMKPLLRTWAELYRVFARCAALVATAEENVCCEELCVKMTPVLGNDALSHPLTLEAVVNVLTVIIECVNFSPYTPRFQQIINSPHTPSSWMRKKNKPLGNLTSYMKLLVQTVDSFHSQGDSEPLTDTPASSMVLVGTSIINILSMLFSNLSLATAIGESLSSLTRPISTFYQRTAKPQADVPKVYAILAHKLEKLLGEILTCLQSRYATAYDDELLEQLAPLLSVLFLHKNKQFRNQIAQFWNATFAKAATLNYPQELKPVLNQVKQKLLIILPGFEAVEVAVDESNGPYSDNSECSQLDTKISGLEVKSAGKRDSLLSRADELKEKHSAPVAVKLDFGSPKPSRRELVLDEEKSVDFVFIPPVPKQRVLTEHQKEVLRTKRVDIPAMYNNLDASQDATLFTQYSQSQEDSTDKPAPDEKTEEATNTPEATLEKQDQAPEERSEDQDEKMEKAPDAAQPDTEIQNNEENNVGSKMETESDSPNPEMDTPEDLVETLKAPDVSKEEPPGVEDVAMETEDSSVNVSNSSTSSDVVSGTPQKPSSRRQSFITLEKFTSLDGNTFSPVRLNTFMGSDSKALKSASQEAVEVEPKEAETPLERSRDTAVDNTIPMPEKPKRGRPKGRKSGSTPVVASKLEKSSEQSVEEKETKPKVEKNDISNSDGAEEDCIPDTQPVKPDSSECVNVEEVEKPQENLVSAKEETVSSVESKENTPPGELENQDNEGQASESQSSQNEPRRSSRRFSQPSRSLDCSESQESEEKGKIKKRGPKTMEEKAIERKASLYNVGQAQHQQASSPAASQTDTQLQGETSKRSNKAPGREDRVTRRSVSTIAVETASPCEAEEGSKEASQGRSRYQTRRSSQGLLSSIENSESDGSETRDDGQKTKKSGRGRKPSKIADSSDFKTEGKSQVVESAAVADQMEITDVENAIEQAVAEDGSTVVLQVPETKNTNETSAVLEPADVSGNFKNEQSVSFDQENKTYSINRTLDTESCSEPMQENKTCMIKSEMSSMSESMITEPSIGDFSTAHSDVFSASAKSENLHFCSHSKRGRGRRRSKVCNRCVADLQQDKDLSGVQDSEKQVLDPKELLSGMSSGGQQFDDSIFDPNAMSTPLLSKDPVFFSTSVNQLASGNELEEEKTTILGTVTLIEGVEQDTLVAATSELSEQTAVAIKETQVEGQQVLETKEVQSETKEHPEQESPTSEVEEEQQLVPLEEWTEDQQPMPDQEKKLEETVQPPEKHPDEVQGVVEEISEATQLEDDVFPTGVVASSLGLPEESLVLKQADSETLNLDSPPKQKGFDAAFLMEIGQSPSGTKPRGVWSPTASPSTSILKKGLKRPLEDDSPSPLHKNRRVSFANPIYQQELADDIDRRSPVVRPSSNGSPRSKGHSASITQQKFVTTPIKGLLCLSPRNLHSPGFKSSKKCLISEMSRESKPIPKDCVYPSLVGCSVPVEAILPQLTSSMWARGFGQLVRAKNVKTVGDLSALTAAEIKALPIRSPKLLNVKKVLRTYHEQQRKLRGDDYLKGFDETEKMTSETEDKEPVLNIEEEEEKLAAEFVGTPVPAAVMKPPSDLPSDVEALNTRFSSEDLGKYSGSQLFTMHQQMSGMLNNIVSNLHSRISSPSLESSD